MDTDRQAEEARVLSVQRKLYQQSKAHPEEVWRDLWGWLTDPRMIHHAWRRVASNRGRRSAGIDGLTVDRIQRRIGEQFYLDEIRSDLRSGAYRPSPSRRKLIPKAGKPGQFRPLGIPTVKDRVVQGAVKTLLEPIFEAQFWPVSYGFRPGRSAHGALEQIRLSIQPRKREPDSRRFHLPYPWVIEGDIKGCFDNINHHHLMDRLRTRITDRRVTGLIRQFLKAGVMAEDQFLRTDDGTPQGGIISPLLTAKAIRARILEETGLTASAGVSYNKFLAKLASGHRKPNGQFAIQPAEGEAFVEALPVAKFHGVGPATATRMHAAGIQTGADLKTWSLQDLTHRFGKAGAWYYAIVRGQDDRAVNPNRERKSSGSETTFDEDLTDPLPIEAAVLAMADDVWAWCEKTGGRGRTVTVKIKWADFQQCTRSQSLPTPVSSRATLHEASLGLIRSVFPPPKGIRLVGVTLSNFVSQNASVAQETFLPSESDAAA